MSETLFADLVLDYLGRDAVTLKGDLPGHEFRGNQYAEGGGSGGGESGGGDGGGSGNGESSGSTPTGPYHSNAEDLGEVQFGKPTTYNGHKEIDVERLNKKGMFESPAAKATIRQHLKGDTDKWAIYLGGSRGNFVGLVEGGLKIAKAKASSILDRVVSVDIMGNYRIRDVDGNIRSINTKGDQ